MKRFRVGDLARFAVAHTARQAGAVGWIVRIRSIGPHWSDEANCYADYEIEGASPPRGYGYCFDYQLEPLLQFPADPISLTRKEECEA